MSFRIQFDSVFCYSMPSIDIYKTFTTCIFMDFIKSELDREFSSIGLKNQRRNVKVLPQVKVQGTDITRDKARKALAPGKRISKSGKTYFETRSNRSDKIGTKV